jgi:hypothetical protein
MYHIDMGVNYAPQLQNTVSVDDIAFDGLFHNSRQNSLQVNSRQNSCTFSRQNSLQVKELPRKLPKGCYCGAATCKEIYMRRSKHPRIIEPSSKLFKYGFDKKVQIRIPKELQAHIGYGSCKHCYKALVTLITYIQIQCGFQARDDVIQMFCAPTEQNIARARHVIQGFGLTVDFYVNKWAPYFQERFVDACGGTVHVQKAMHKFFVEKPINDKGWIDSALELLEPEKHSLEHYIERIRTVLENKSSTNMHKFSMCNAVLYECLSKQ